MIKLNKQIIETGHFPDGTILMKQDVSDLTSLQSVKIEWFFENNEELITLIFLTKHLNANGIKDVELYLPYIPNARQDRVKNNEDVFTLKYFAEVINSLNFKTVTALDPHSNVSEALIDNIRVEKPTRFIEATIKKITEAENETPSLFYPDEGAGKRYSGMIPLPYAFGIKKRDWATGQIKGLDVAGDVDNINGKNILIVDDICSKGGTFFFSAKKLKELGAKNIYLYITHCENTILCGELLTSGLIKRIYTTDSIFTAKHSIIEVSHLD
jgi:ribose-phosphate pyrophosphokinase